MFIFNERGNQNQNAESKSRGRIANLQYKIKSEWIINKLQKHTQAPKKIKSGVFFWLKPGGYYLLVLSNIDLLSNNTTGFGNYKVENYSSQSVAANNTYSD